MSELRDRIGDAIRKPVRPLLAPLRGVSARLNQAGQMRRIQAMEHAVDRLEAVQAPSGAKAPVLFFNATSGPGTVSFNALAALVISWSLRLKGQCVRYVVCNRAMTRCVQGTNPNDLSAPPPCADCLRRRQGLHPLRLTRLLDAPSSPPLAVRHLAECSLDALAGFRYQGLELGALCLPSVRWTLRRHTLDATPQVRQLYTEYLHSAIGIVDEFERILAEDAPRSAVVFNGTFYPEAVLRALCVRRGVPVISHEVGFAPSSLFLSHAAATEYRLNIPDDFQMGPGEEAELDRYIANRARGKFDMGGVTFWPAMHNLPADLQQAVGNYRNTVAIFTNVIFDTSQIYANRVFGSMFEWLKVVLELARANPDSLFVVRAHPDEMRPGKASTEPVGEWMRAEGYLNVPNVVLIPPGEYVSSYDLIDVSDVCLVYNSTVGIEATIMGTPVVAGGMSRYQQEAFTYAPEDDAAFRELVGSFLQHGIPPLSEVWRQRARRYMYYSVFRSALDFSAYIDLVSPFNYGLRPFRVSELHPDTSATMATIYNGIVNGGSFQS